MEQRLKELLRRLTFLGYRSFEIRNIIREATGNCDFALMSKTQHKQVIRHLERYEQLGLNFLQAYSK